MRQIKYRKRRTPEQIKHDTETGTKECPECLVRKPHSEYGKNGSTVDGLHNLCRDCGNAQARKYGKDNKRKRRDGQLRSLYGVGLEDFERMLEEQDGKCAICRTDTFIGKGQILDHCHETGDVRGVLCHNCNSGLGHFKDNEHLLLSALRYLHASRHRHREHVGSQDDPHYENNQPGHRGS